MNPASPELQQLLQLVRRVDDRQQLAELLSRYGMAVDDRDFDAIGRQFAPDGEFHGVKGRQQIVEFYRARTSTFSTSSHYALTWHFDFTDDDHASGVVNAHAELCIGGKTVRLETYYSDFKKVAGVRLPRRIRTLADGRLLHETRIKDYDANPNLPADFFTPPVRDWPRD